MPHLLLLLAALLVFASGAHAQATRLVVVVADAELAAPVPGVRAVANGVDAMTDAQGRAGWQGLAPGAVRVEVRSAGHAPLDTVLSVPDGQTVVAVLPLTPLALAPVEVEAESRNDALLRRRGFFERREGRSGVFLTRGELDARGAVQLSDAFSGVAGVRVDRSGGQAALVSARRGGCQPVVFIDGTEASYLASQIDSLPLTDVAAIEIYRGPSEVPMLFARRGSRTPCGAVLVWTRIEARD